MHESVAGNARAGERKAVGAGPVCSFARSVRDFETGAQTPRDFLEHCLATIAQREPEVKAFVTLDIEGARAAADRSTARYRAGRPLSMVDGCPVGIKDIMDTSDMPTQMGSAIYAGWRPRFDAACVQALRDAGAVLVGKTVTTEFACGGPGATTNPHDIARTPGGSSSGSAAAVGAGMLPVALGTQTQGSTLRPASFCGAVGFKPTHGVLPMAGVHPISTTHDHLGVIGATLDDTWRIASHISLAIGSPGRPHLSGAGEYPPGPRKPQRLIRLYTRGWEEADAATRAAFDVLIAGLVGDGVQILSRETNRAVADLEATLDSGLERQLDITAYEMKWPYAQYVARHDELVAQRIRDRLTKAQAMAPAHYEHLLNEKAAMREKLHVALRGLDGLITLAASGPAPLGLEHTGSRTFLIGATLLGVPAFSLPLMSVAGMPLGLQLIGAHAADGDLCAVAHWLMRPAAR